MVWSYNLSLLAQQGKDYVRFLIGDTFIGDQQLQDEEINMAISTRTSPYGAAAECCRALANKFSRSVDQAAGTSKVSYSQMAKAYIARALDFENKASADVLPYMGGISSSDMASQENNTDRVSPAFTIGMTDNWLPEAPTGPETQDTSEAGENPGTQLP